MAFIRARRFALGCALGLLAAGPALAAEDDATVAATVNGETILVEEVRQLHANLPQMSQVPFEAVYQPLVSHLIDSRLVVAEARGQDLQDAPEVQDEITRAVDDVLRRAYLRRQVEARVDEAALKARYDDFVAENPPQEEIRARHILVDTEEAAREAIAALGGDADFADVAKEMSKGPSAARGGDLGYFTKGEMVPAFAEAAFALDVGAVSDAPVESEFGWHVIKVEDRRATETPAFDDVKDQLRAQVAEQAAQEAVAELREGAEIERFGMDGEPVAEKAAE